METRGLQLFLSVVKFGSISKASETMNIAQPALGLQIRKLEDELGIPLFERHSRGVRPTEAGLLLAKHAEIILRNLDNAKQELTDFRAFPSGHVGIGLPPSTQETIAPELFRIISQDYPAMKLTIREALSYPLLRYLNNWELDAALVFDDRAGHSEDDLVFEPLASDHLMFVYPLEWQRDSAPTIGFADILKEKLILSTKPNFIRSEVERLAAGLRLTPAIIHEVDSVSAIRNLVSSGLGCSIMPRGAVASPVYADRIGVKRIVEPEIKRLLHLTYSRTRPFSNAAETAKDVLRQIVLAEIAKPHSDWQSVA